MMRITPLIRGERVLVRRRAKKMTQAQCARAVGVTPRTIRQIERSRRYRAHVEILGRLALALGTSTDYLLGLTDNPEPAFHHEPG